jgi:hypothetical protein
MSTADEKIKRIEAIIQEWVDKQGHERCWYYPELFRELGRVLDIHPSVQPGLPPRAEFEEGCRRYQEEEYAKGKR